MKNVSRIKSVDIKIKAKGHGVVNFNGSASLTGQNGKIFSNHVLPKLRGYTNNNGRIKEENGYKYKKEMTDINLKETPLYISQNCIRHHLFRDQAYDLHFANEKNVEQVLVSQTGLIRGYVIPASQHKRTSPLLIEDFVDQLGNGNFEQFSQAGERDNSSFFSKTTFGDTEYISYASINIEDLEFISLDNKFDDCAMTINEGQGHRIAQKIQYFIQSLNPDSNPIAVYHDNYVRKGTIFNVGQCGILLNDDAIQVLVEHTIELISNLYIRQAKSYMYVDEIIIDYNDSNKLMRIKRNESEIVSEKRNDYAIYFETVEKNS